MQIIKEVCVDSLEEANVITKFCTNKKINLNNKINNKISAKVFIVLLISLKFKQTIAGKSMIAK